MRLIDADKIYTRITWMPTVNAMFKEEIDKQPTVKAKFEIHAHWFLLKDCSNAGVYCSHCHKKCYTEKAWYGNVKQKSKYCPNCGATMDEVVDENKLIL